MTANVTRDQLHQLVDDLPESQWSSAERALSYLRLLANATPDDEAWTDDDETAIEEAEAEVASGAFISHDEARRQLLERR
jgi:hypothetical protein